MHPDLPSLPVSRAGSPRTIALVDDDPHIGQALKQWLQVLQINSRGYLSAEALQEALHAADGQWWLHGPEGEPPVRLTGAVLDLNLPGMNGVALGQWLQSQVPDLPVVVITAAPQDAALLQTAAHSRITVLKKPFSLDALEQALRL